MDDRRIRKVHQTDTHEVWLVNDPDFIPPVNTFFKAIVVLVILCLLTLAAFGAAMIVVAVLP